MRINDMDIKGNENDSDSCFVMHPFFQGRHYVEAVKKCRFHFLRVLYTARSSFMQQTPETIFRIPEIFGNKNP